MSKNSANILVFGWSIIVLAIVGLGLLLEMNFNKLPSQELLILGSCPLEKSFYKKSDLKNSEKEQFSSNAVGVSIIGSSGLSYRIIMDYSYISELRDKLRVKILVKSVGQGKISNISAIPLLNGVRTENNSKANPGETPLYNSFELSLSTLQNTVGVLLSKENDCEIKIDDLFNLSKAEELGKKLSPGLAESNPAVSIISKDHLQLLPGINYFGSLDWFDLKNLTKAGLKVAYYDSKTKSWVREKKFGQPRMSYVIYNPSKENLNIEVPGDYRVPDDINFPQVSQGWNLLYLAGSKPLETTKVSFNSSQRDFVASNSYTLRSLVDKNLASNISYRLKGEKLEKVDLNSFVDTLEGPLWFYINKEQFETLKQINLSLKIDGGGETYQKGQFIPFKIFVSNNDSESHYLVPSSEIDPCQLKVIITDEKEKEVLSSADEGCSLWPNLEKLSPGAKKEYNYTWQVPKNISGNLVLSAYFDYSRLGGQKLVSRAKVLIK